MNESDERQKGGAIGWMADNSVAANLLMMLLVVGGLLMASQIKREVFPEVSLDAVTIRLPYPGAGPEEIEQAMLVPVEQSIREIDGIQNVQASASEGMGTVTAELSTWANQQQVANDVKSSVDRIQVFPKDAEEPLVQLATNRRQVATVAIHGDVDRRTLKQRAEAARDELLNSDEISVVSIDGLPPPEISIEVSQENLRRYNLTLPDLADRLAASSVDLPSGSLQTEGGELLLRTTERRERAEEYRNAVVISRPDGTRVRLGEIAEVRETFRRTDRATFFNGERAVKVQVYRVGTQTPMEISKEVEAFVERKKHAGTTAGSYEVWNDESELYASRMDLLLDNAYLGLALVVLITGLFLGLEIAFWAAAGMTISFLGAVMFMPALGVSLNMISLFAFILTLGVVVDDAIVVGEAIYTARDAEVGSVEAAIEGAREVAVPVTFAVLTTVVTFAPLLFVPGAMGKFFIQTPLIVIPILLVSLVECLFILPAHLAHTTSLTDWGVVRELHQLQQRFSRGVERVVTQVYRPLAELAFRFRYATIATGVALCVVTVGLIGGGVLKFTFIPRIEKDEVKAGVQMPISTPVGETRKVTGRLVDEAKRTIAELESSNRSEKISEGILAEIGTSSIIDANDGSHLTEVVVSLVPSDQRDITAREFAQRWRERVGQVPGAESVAFDFDIGPGSGATVSFDLHHENKAALRRAAERLAEKLQTYEGVVDVDDGFQRGKEQLDLTLKPQARALGVTEAMLARQMRGAFYGIEVDRIQRGREELRVNVRRPENERDSERDLEEMLIQTPEGGEIPLTAAANIQRGRAPTTISRTEGGRVITVTADVDSKATTGSEITSTIEKENIPELKEQFPGLGYEVSGNQQDRQRSLKALGLGFLFALMVIYGLMAVLFQSYIQPVVVMAAIPFGFVGAAAGHLLMGFNLSLVSMMGFVALSGIVVNNSMVLISSVNGHRDKGYSAFEAAVTGGVRRFRPIVLTSLTTFFGLGPMIFETSVQAKFLIPMALSLGFGVLFVTCVSLLLVPALYLVVTDIKGVLGGEEEGTRRMP